MNNFALNWTLIEHGSFIAFRDENNAKDYSESNNAANNQVEKALASLFLMCLCLNKFFLGSFDVVLIGRSGSK